MGGAGGSVGRHRPLADAREFQRRVDVARARITLSDLIGRYTKLTRAGRELSGLCIFHNERSPSLHVNDDKGIYHCFGCGASGDAIRFLTDHCGMSFMDALRDLEGGTYPEVTPEQRAQRRKAAAEEMAARIAVAREIWGRSVPAEGTPAEVYARSRGITMQLPATVRFVMTPRWRDPETGEVGRDYPAMACALQDATNAIVGVQCVFLSDGGRRKYERVGRDGKKAKAKLSYGQVIGSAFRARRAPGQNEIIICEGPEDGLTLAQELTDRQVWVACGTAMMPEMDFPSDVRSIIIAGQNDAPGRAAVETAGPALAARDFAVRTIFPASGFKDWNDQLRGLRMEQSR